MVSLISGEYPPTLKPEEKDALIETAKDWSIGNGLAVRPPPTVIASGTDPKGIVAINVPVTLFPSPFPRQCFSQGKAVQKTYNELYASMVMSLFETYGTYIPRSRLRDIHSTYPWVCSDPTTWFTRIPTLLPLLCKSSR
jgi:hypothetical protein